MDSFTQDMLDRAKQRRELLSQKMSEVSPRRKRSSPLHESTNTEIEENHDDSFQKRQRLLQSNEENTSPISYSRSSVKGLAALRRSRPETKMEVDQEQVTRAKSEPPKSLQVGGRRNRLAALAQNINDWEEDLSRPTFNKEAPKKVWQPPKPLVEDGTCKPAKTYNSSPVKNRTASPFKSPCKSQVEASQASPLRSLPSACSPKNDPSIVETSPPNQKTHLSSITIQLGSSKESQSQKLAFVEGTTTQPSPTQRGQAENINANGNLTFVPGRTSELTPSRFVSKGSPAKSSPVSKASEEVEKAVSSKISMWQQKCTEDSSMNKSKSSAEEQTEKPVAARLALWQKKVTQAENETKENSANIKPMLNKNYVTPAKSQTAVDQLFNKVKTPVQPAATAMKSTNFGTKSPLKSPGTASPKKIAEGTKIIQSKLQSLQGSWKSNEIAEQISKQREADLGLLQNRWKGDAEKEAEETVKPSVPPPPPLPIAKNSPKTSTIETPAQTASKTPKGPKREAARAKLRVDFENKLQAMGFEVSSASNSGHVATFDLTPIKAKEKAERENAEKSSKYLSPKKDVFQTPKPVSPKKQSTTPAATPGRSIFSLIRGGTPASHQPGNSPHSTPVLNTGHQSSSTNNDSFEDEFEDVNLEAEPKQERRSVHFERPSSSQSEYTDAASTCSEEQIEGSTTPDDYSEGEDIYGSREFTTENSESEYSEEEAAEDGQANISELLDEAMDSDDTEEAPQPAPRRKRSTSSTTYEQRQVYTRMPQTHHPQVQATTHVTVQPDARGSHVNIKTCMETKMRDIGSSSAQSSSCTESESDDREVVYSIDMYRSAKNAKKGTPNPKMIIVRHADKDPRPPEPEEPMPRILDQDVKTKLHQLQEMVNQEQTVIMQTSKALNKCCNTGSAFHGSAEAVECHRILLMACKKREAYLGEMTRLRERRIPPPSGPQGCLTISDIRLPLKQEFTARMGGPSDNTVHYFIVMIRNGAHVIFSQMVSTRDAMIRGSLDIPNLIKLNDIREDFRVEVQVYGMSVTTEEMTPKKKRGLTPRKKQLKSAALTLQSPGGPSAVHTTNFTYIASLTLTMRCLDKTHFSLDKLPFSSPLNGTIHLRMRCLMETRISRRGFLTMFEDVSGFGAWHRRWCVLHKNTLSYWKYPDDEKYKEPMGIVDLKSCISDRVDLISRDICARPNSFELLTVRRQYRGEGDTLVTKVYNTMTTRKNWFAADTKEERISWCNTLNEALTNLRMWHPDAMRPIKRQAQESNM